MVRLDSKQYGFLKTHPQLGEQLVFLTLSGSIGYGTNRDGSDIDLRGVTIESKDTLYGFQRFEQYEDSNTDTVIYGLKKFVNLAMKANPNILELLGTKEEHLVYQSPIGISLRENKHVFLSKRVVDSFGNYATAQFRRLQNALVRDHYPIEEKERHILQTLNKQISHFNQNYEPIKPGGLILHRQNSGGELSEIVMDIAIKDYPLRDFVNIYAEMSNIVRDYDKLNHRNRKKDDGKLAKHAMHLVRLYLMGIELLKTKDIRTYRDGDLELLMAIRNGEMSFEEVFILVEKLENQFETASKLTTLPEEPDEIWIENWLIAMYESFYDHKQLI